MNERKIWFVTRPERDPKYHADAIKALAEATNNFSIKWKRNRELHKHFESVLASKGLKRKNISTDGSGGRTWAAMLKTFAYCYIDTNGYIKPTKVGEALIEGKKEYENVKKQILTLQIPNAYFLEGGFNPKFDSKFKIRPARFLIKVVQSEKLDFYVTKEEITYFVLTAQKDSDLPSVISSILKFRMSTPEQQKQIKEDISVKYEHRQRGDNAARDYFDSHSDVAHTFMMICEYTDLAYYLRREAILRADPDLASTAKEVLAYYDERYPFNNRYLISLQRMAQNNGLDVDSYKANDYGTIKPAGNLAKRAQKIEATLSQIPNPTEMTKEELIELFRPTFGPHEAVNIVENLQIKKSNFSAIQSDFVERYLGELSPLEFEEETTKILEAIGFEVVYKPKINGENTEIEIFVKYGNHAGIIDTKYYETNKGFSLPQHLANYMGSQYIPNYLNYSDIPLTFYGYVTSSKFSGEKKLSGITTLAAKLTNHHIKGFIVTRQTLIGFLDYCVENGLTIDERINLFINAIQNKAITDFFE